MWKRLFIVVIILLVSSSAFGGYFWYQLNVTKNQLADTKVQLDNTLAELDTAEAQLDDTEALLDITKEQLDDTENLLDTTLVELDATKAQLTDTKTLLDTTQTQLVDTEAKLGTTKAQLDVTTTQLGMATAQLEIERNKNSQMLNQYASLKEQVNVRLGDTPEDKQNFINPSNSSVSAKVVEITGGYSEDINEYWRDCERLYQWVVNNISYSYDSHMPILPESISGGLIWQQDYWRMPEETLEDETGDCEDMAVLLASMLRSYNEGKYQIWVLVIRSSVPEAKGHAAVAFPVQGGELAILDPAGNYYTGQYESLQSESASVAVNNWLSHWQSEMPGAEIIGVFSEDIFEEFSNTAEFITWAQE